MGHRANFVVIKEGTATAYYDPWAALYCVYQFTSGPLSAVKYLENMKPTTTLLDQVSMEGGYLLDFDNKTAILFGFVLDYFYRNGDRTIPKEIIISLNESGPEGPLAFFNLISDKWRGWKLIWDESGVEAFLDYLKLKDIHTVGIEWSEFKKETYPAFEYQA